MDRKGDAMMLKIRNLDPILSNFENYIVEFRVGFVKWKSQNFYHLQNLYFLL